MGLGESARIREVERSVLSSLNDADAELFRRLMVKVAATGPVVEACDVPGIADC